MDTAYIKKIGFYLVLAFLALSLIASLLYHAFVGISENLELMFVKEISENDSAKMQAFLALNEYAIQDDGYVDGKSTVEYVSGKSSYVSTGDIVARLYENENAETMLNRISELRKKIEFCEQASQYASKYSVANLISMIEKCEKDISTADSFESESAQRQELELLLAAHASRMDSSFDYSVEINQYEAEISAIYSSLGTAETIYRSEMNGAYFAECDGYEAMLTEAVIKEGDLDTLYGAVTREDDDPNREIGELGKVADLNKWRLVCATDRQTSLRVKAGDRMNVVLASSGKTYRLTVESVVSRQDRDEAVVVFSSSVMLPREDYMHFQTVEVIFQAKEGYKVPITAVRYESGVSGVYVLRGSLVKFRQIDIIASGDGYVVASNNFSATLEGVSALQYYDRIIVRGQNLYDGKVIFYD